HFSMSFLAASVLVPAALRPAASRVAMAERMTRSHCFMNGLLRLNKSKAKPGILARAFSYVPHPIMEAAEDLQGSAISAGVHHPVKTCPPGTGLPGCFTPFPKDFRRRDQRSAQREDATEGGIDQPCPQERPISTAMHQGEVEQHHDQRRNEAYPKRIMPLHADRCKESEHHGPPDKGPRIVSEQQDEGGERDTAGRSDQSLDDEGDALWAVRAHHQQRGDRDPEAALQSQHLRCQHCDNRDRCIAQSETQPSD